LWKYVTWADTASYLKRRLLNVVYNVTYSPSHRQASGPVINMPSALHAALDLCKNVSFAVVFGNNGNSYIISMQSDTCICSTILRNIETMT